MRIELASGRKNWVEKAGHKKTTPPQERRNSRYRKADAFPKATTVHLQKKGGLPTTRGKRRETGVATEKVTKLDNYPVKIEIKKQKKQRR